MVASLLKRCISVCSVVCVLALAFFPLPHGPFQATHGPTTAFRSRWSFLILLLVVAMALVRALFRILSIVPPLRLAGLWKADSPLIPGSASSGCAVLRC